MLEDDVFDTLRSRDESRYGDLPHDERYGAGASVVLATLASTPFDAGAIRLAVEASVENAARLIVVNVVDCSVGGRGPRTDIGDPPDVAAALRSVVEQATAAGVSVTSIRVC